ncbi:hypothetical protein [Chelativorans sp. YIM 93263]|uniref:hypothetical protein n=1 Tax=Chelativorans sp. YIM 93263 TaxID=2906648 RepID=UPI00237A05F3|nr:hypothetical protein [Chelativorans sp. YIM 93263]
MMELILATMIATSDVKVEIDSISVEHQTPEVMLKVTNAGTRFARSVFIDCVFFDEERKAVDIGKALIRDLGPNQTKYGSAATTKSTAHSVKCNAASVWPN